MKQFAFSGDIQADDFMRKDTQTGQIQEDIMTQITDIQAFRKDLTNAVLCWLATVDASGAPNVSPKEMFSWDGNQQIIIADIASARSVENIRQLSKVCLSFIDVFRQRGFKITGSAQIIPTGSPNFAAIGHDVLARIKGEFRVQNLIVVTIESVSRVLAPSYFTFPERNEAEHIRQTLESYSVNRLLYGK